MSTPLACKYVIPTPQLQRSKEYFQKLGFCCEEDESGMNVYDSTLSFYVDKRLTSRAGWTFQVKNLEDFIRKSGLHFIEMESEWLTVDNGIWIRITESTLPSSRSSTDSSSILGDFAGISIEVFDIGQAADVYSKFGFTKTMGSEESGWISMEREDGAGLSLMKYGSCPHLFFNPSLTYFNSGKNPEIIEKLRVLEIPLAQEIDHFNKQGIVDNVILQEAGGTGIFVFND